METKINNVTGILMPRVCLGARCPFIFLWYFDKLRALIFTLQLRDQQQTERERESVLFYPV